MCSLNDVYGWFGGRTASILKVDPEDCQFKETLTIVEILVIYFETTFNTYIF
jgi:hypothetical protein